MRTVAVAPGIPSPLLGRTFRECPICGACDLDYDFIVDGYPACTCRACSFLFLNPQPPFRDREPSAESAPEDPSGPYDIHAVNAASRLNQLTRYAALRGGRLLLVGASDELLSEARRRGFDLLPLCADELESGPLDRLEPGSVDACLLYCALEKTDDPTRVLDAIHQSLVPGGA